MIDKSKVNYILYLVTDSELMSTATVEESVELAIKGGVTAVQLREKKATSREFYERALRVKQVTDRYDVPLIINDRVDIALAAGAAGVHLGQKDLPPNEARKLLGPDKIMGLSARTVEAAVKAQESGADYLGVGAMFATGTKNDAIVITKERLSEIRAAVDIPIVAIGGINLNNAALLRGTGVNGLAVVSGIIAQDDIEDTARHIRMVFK